MQATLFDAPAGKVRHSDPVTSLEAARSITPGRTERLILEAFHREGYRKPRHLRGFTDDELCTWMPTLHSPTVKSARSRLSNQGLLEDSGERRPSIRGRDQIVWRLK